MGVRSELERLAIGEEPGEDLRIERQAMRRGQLVECIERQLLRTSLVVPPQALGAQVTPLGRSETFVPIDTEAVSESDRRACEASTASIATRL